jgi:hypothetical protein
LHPIDIIRSNVLLVLHFEFCLALRSLLLLFTHFHGSAHLLRLDLPLFLLKISLSLRNHILRIANVRALLTLEVLRRPHFRLLPLLPCTLRLGELTPVQSSLTLYDFLPLLELQFFVLHGLFMCLTLALILCIFLLNFLNISLKSIDPMLELLHVLAGLLHIALFIHHDLRFELGLGDHGPVHVLVIGHTIVVLVVLESLVSRIAIRLIQTHAAALRVSLISITTWHLFG